MTASKKACHSFQKEKTEKNNDNEIKKKQIDISNQLICDYYISDTPSAADYFMRLIVSVSLGGRLRFRLCKNKRALFVWECDSIN